jgi:SAM-dependent methyltransferase
MSEVFGSVYGDAYDLLYYDKDYAAECDLINRIFKTYGHGHFRDILDLGCGTGNHSLPLARQGYKVVGIDRSSDMLAHARTKAADAELNGKTSFYEGDILNIDLERQFDAVLIMFAVLGYQVENSDVLSALRTARRHLRSGGLLIFDVWYGPAVLHQRPSDRLKVIPSPEGRILRVASGELDVRRHLCTVHFRVWRLAGDRLVTETEETHPMRYFFPLELNLFLECCGFNLVRLGGFPDLEREPDETTWNVLGVAHAI